MCWLIRKWILRLFLSFKDLPKRALFSSRNYRYLALSSGDQKQPLPLQFREEALPRECFDLLPLFLLGKSQLARRSELSSLGRYSEEIKLQLSECDWRFIDDCFKKGQGQKSFIIIKHWCSISGGSQDFPLPGNKCSNGLLVPNCLPFICRQLGTTIPVFKSLHFQ